MNDSARSARLRRPSARRCRHQVEEAPTVLAEFPGTGAPTLVAEDAATEATLPGAQLADPYDDEPTLVMPRPRWTRVLPIAAPPPVVPRRPTPPPPRPTSPLLLVGAVVVAAAEAFALGGLLAQVLRLG